jgi:hypothetical protein
LQRYFLNAVILRGGVFLFIAEKRGAEDFAEIICADTRLHLFFKLQETRRHKNPLILSASLPCSLVAFLPIACCLLTFPLLVAYLYLPMLQQKIKDLARQYHPEFIEVRHHLHAHPELSYQEHETAKYVQQKLASFGITFEIKAGTGVVGLIEGKNPASRVDQKRRESCMPADMMCIPHACWALPVYWQRPGTNGKER